MNEKNAPAPQTCFICGHVMDKKYVSNYAQQKENRFSFASRKAPEYMHFDIYECRRCLVLKSQPHYDLTALNKQYEQASFDSTCEAQLASNTYLSYLTRQLPDFSPKKVLDIGTGEGSFLLNVHKRWPQAQLVGVEPSKAPVQMADASIARYIRNEPFTPGHFQEGEFDLITCFQTVEHIPDSVSLLCGVHRLLQPNGYAYVVCHDYCFWVNRVLGVKSPIYDIEHLQIYSQKSIRLLFEKVGFKNIRLFYIRNTYPLNYWLKMSPLPGGLKRLLSGTWGSKFKVGVCVGNIGVLAQK